MSSDVLRDQLLLIKADNDGLLTPQAVVMAATPEDHPLHNRFEWDDAIAAEKHRVDQARNLIRLVRVEFLDSRGEPQSVRVFHSVQRPDLSKPVYETIQDIAESEFASAQLLTKMNVEWRAMKRRYGHLTAFTELLRREAAEAGTEREAV